MRQVSIHEAKTQLSRLIKDVEAGGEIVIRRGNTPVAKLVPLHEPLVDREPGAWKGHVVIQPGFYAPLGEDELAEFYPAG